MTLSFRTDRSRQTMQTQISLLLEQQSDPGLHCLLFHLHHFDKILKVWLFCSNFRLITAKNYGVPKLRNSTVHVFLFPQLPPSVVITVCSVWSLMVCLSRLYLGVHTVLVSKETLYLYPPQKVVLGGYTVDSVIPRSFFFMVLLCNFSTYCPILFKFSPHLSHQTLHVL